MRDLVAAALAAPPGSEGRRQAFTELVGPWLPTAEQLARRLCRTTEEAEDCLQEAVLQAYLSLDRLRRPAAFPSWLCGIVANTARRQRAGRWREPELREPRLLAEMAGGTVTPLAGIEPGPHEALELAEVATAVSDAIEDLSPALREAAWLYYMEALRPAEVAAQLAVSGGVVRTRLHRARGLLRDALREAWEQWAVPPLEGEKMVDAEIYDVFEQHVAHVVMLRGSGERFVPIFIDPGQAIALTYALRDAETPRPMSAALTFRLLEAAGLVIGEVRVDRIVENVFFSTIVVRGADGARHEVDARPSDALCLAALAKCPIKLAEPVLEQAGFDVEVEIRRPALSYVDRALELKRVTFGRPVRASKDADAEPQPAGDKEREAAEAKKIVGDARRWFQDWVSEASTGT